MRKSERAILDDETNIVYANDQEWIGSWHPPSEPPAGTPHGASAICVTGNGQIVLISPDGVRWGLPGGRTEAGETWEETLRREMLEEACATVVRARLLGFSRSICVAGTQAGLILVRSFWRADVTLAPWKPLFEIPHRRVFVPDDVSPLLVSSHPDGSAPVLLRVWHEAMTDPDVNLRQE